MNNTKKKLNWTLITKYITGNANSKEKNQAELTIKSSALNYTLYNQLRTIWDKSQLYSIVNVNTQIAWENFINRTQYYTYRKKELLIRFSKIAASIAIIISLFYLSLLYFNSDIKIISGNTIQHFELSDGSKIDLNKHASIIYPKTFEGSFRKVKLLEGEAFFDVKPNKNKPFIIETKYAIIMVLGTSFNINVSSAGDFDVIVANGKVAVKVKNIEKQVVLLKDEKAQFSRNENLLTKMPNNNLNYLAWKTKQLVFKETSLQEVYATISKVYDISINITDSTIFDYKLTATYNNLTINEILKIIDRTFQLASQVNNQEVIITKR